jgi:hypothetical protein
MRYDPEDELTCMQRMWMLLDDPSFSRGSFMFAQLSLTAILISTVSFCLETEFNCEPSLIAIHGVLTEENCATWELTWWYFEAAAVIFFTAELLLRFISCPSKRRFVKGGANWIDLLAILPFYLEILAGDVLSAFSVFRVIRLVRVFRVFKMGKSFAGLNLMVTALKESGKVLGILTFLILIATIVFSSAIFYLEANGVGSHWFRSIPRSFWWCFVTMTTVGYGDSYPMTDIGRTIAVGAMISGILILAMPITVIGANFANAYKKQTFEENVISTCTREILPGESHKGEPEGTEVVDLERLMGFLRDLELRGNLAVEKPKDQAELQLLLNEYDAKGDGVFKMQKREWQAFLKDCVMDAKDFTGVTVSKLAQDVDELRHGLRLTQGAMDEMHADLKELLELVG